jgi:hypothetical protein
MSVLEMFDFCLDLITLFLIFYFLFLNFLFVDFDLIFSFFFHNLHFANSVIGVIGSHLGFS